MNEIGTKMIVSASINRLMLTILRILKNFSRALVSSAVDMVLMRITSSIALQLYDAPMIWIPHSTMKRAENSAMTVVGTMMMAKLSMRANRVIRAAK